MFWIKTKKLHISHQTLAKSPGEGQVKLFQNYFFFLGVGLEVGGLEKYPRLSPELTFLRHCAGGCVGGRLGKALFHTGLIDLW